MKVLAMLDLGFWCLVCLYQAAEECSIVRLAMGWALLMIVGAMGERHDGSAEGQESP